MTPDKANEMNKEKALDNGYRQAFPLSTGTGYPHLGLTKREYMATQIMCSLITKGYSEDVSADLSVKAVDRLLIALHINTGE